MLLKGPHTSTHMHSQWPHRDVRTQRPCSLSGVTCGPTVSVGHGHGYYSGLGSSHQVGKGCTRMRPKLHLPVASEGRFHWQVPSHWARMSWHSSESSFGKPAHLQGGVACPGRLGSFIIKTASSKKESSFASGRLSCITSIYSRVARFKPVDTMEVVVLSPSSGCQCPVTLTVSDFASAMCRSGPVTVAE
jgi:hypothetical protein